jgi:Fe-S oxidoreductase
MLPLDQKYAFLLFAIVALAWGVYGFVRLYRRIRRGRPDPDQRSDHIFQRLWYALTTTLSQARTFQKRGIVSTFHAFIFYGFAFYILVNLVDTLEAYFPFSISSATIPGAAYNLFADILSLLVLVGVIALVLRRFFLPSRRDFRFNANTMLHPDVRRGYIALDSLIVSGFILFHVGSRAVGAGARIAMEGSDKYQPFATLISHLFTTHDAYAWRVFGFWGALGSVLLFLAYFPYTKHVHIFMAPAKYFFARRESSGVLPQITIDLNAEDQQIGADRLEDLSWARLLDSYACIQCNRCQDVCPATATGKSLSPSALEINKRMELNDLAKKKSGFGTGAPSPRPLLQFAMTPEAAWACTTCGACMQVCPVQDDQMLDIVDVRRDQVMIKGEFPLQLQTAFRGMERSQNPWGINHDKRMDWAEGLQVKTTDQNPDPDVLYWVGCAASYDPQAQRTARAFVQLLNYANVNFAVLGKKECCTGDSARRAGNELLYRELADKNVATLNTVKPRLIVATCPHCMNAIGNEYKQIGGSYSVIHHTQYLEMLIAAGDLDAERLDASITYHDPCYLGRHNGVYDAPRNILKVLGNELIELERNRENAFCCGAGGAQFWKEEEPGSERISENRFDEVKKRLASAKSEKTLAVGCPFCKSMLSSTPGKSENDGIVVRDVAELLLESLQKKRGISPALQPELKTGVEVEASPIASPKEEALQPSVNPAAPQASERAANPEKVERKKWKPAKPSSGKSLPASDDDIAAAPREQGAAAQQQALATGDANNSPKRRKWQPKPSLPPDPEIAPDDHAEKQ